MTYVNLTDYNFNDEPRLANLVFNGNIVGFNELHCTKFRLQSSSYPLFVPHIVDKESINDLHIKDARNMKLTLENTPHQNLQYHTSWNICCFDNRHGGTHDGTVYKGRYVNHNVKWTPHKNHKMKPFEYPKTRREVLNNPYFHSYNSIHVISLIAKTLREIGENMGHPRLFYIVKVDGGYQILRQVSKDPNDNITPNLFFNKALRDCFYFHYDDTFLFNRNGEDSDYSEVIFDVNNKSSYTFDGETSEYLISQTLGLTSRLFPFSEIQFQSSSLKINPIRECFSGVNQEIPSNVSVVLSYMLNVTDIDSIVDNMHYNVSSILHPSVIQDSTISSFNVTANFRTFDGFSFPIVLQKNDSLNLFLEFI